MLNVVLRLFFLKIYQQFANFGYINLCISLKNQAEFSNWKLYFGKLREIVGLGIAFGSRLKTESWLD